MTSIRKLWSIPRELNLSITKNRYQKYDLSRKILEWKSRWSLKISLIFKIASLTKELASNSKAYWYILIGITQLEFVLFKVKNRNNRTTCKICSKLITKTPEQHHWRHSGVFIVNFEQISHIILMFPLLTLNK